MSPLRSVIASSCLATLFACSGGGGSSPTAPPPPRPPLLGDSLSIVKVEPPRGSTLAPGKVVTVEARLAYRFGKMTGGELAYVVVCSAGGKLSCLYAGTLARLDSSSGEIVVRVNLNPIGESASVQFDLVPADSQRSTASARVSYRINQP